MTPRSSSERGLVLVTGGSGYVAGYCIAELLNDGWSVRTTIRSVANAKAVRASIGAIASNAAEFEIVEADLNSDAGWSEAAVGARYALHVASPVPVTDPKNDDELVRPARDGTLRVLKAARDAGVKRVAGWPLIALPARSYGRPGRAGKGRGQSSVGASGNASEGRRARLRGSPGEGLESAPKPSFR